MPDAPGDEVTPTRAFQELAENLEYARDLINAGTYLEKLRTHLFDRVVEAWR